MTTVPQEHSSSLQRPLVLGAVLTAFVLTLLFAHAVAAYWGFYHLGTSGSNGMALVFLVIPVGLVLSVSLVFFVARAFVRRGSSTVRGLSLGALATTLVFAALFTLEIQRTAAERGGEGAGDLAPYILHHLGGRR
jgi:hypothetical protein